MAKKAGKTGEIDYEKLAKSEREAEVARQRELHQTMPPMLIRFAFNDKGNLKVHRMKPRTRRQLGI